MSALLDNNKIDIFEEYLKGNRESLSMREKVTLNYLLDSLYGSRDNNNLMEKIGKKEFTPKTSDFAPIEASILAFIEKYIQDGKLVDNLKPTIPYWPCSKE